MRISELIKKLERVKHEHGDVQIRAYDRDGDTGAPVVECSTFFVSGNKNPSTRWFVKAKDR